MASESARSSRSSSQTERSGRGSSASGTGTGAGSVTGSGSGSVSVRGSLCTFWIGQRCLGLSTGLVGEVVTVEEAIRVPLAPSAVRGVFSLRGQPVALVSLASVLGFEPSQARSAKSTTAMVLRSSDLVVGLIIDRMEAVIPLDRGSFSPPTNAEEDAVVLGFLEVKGDARTDVIAILDPDALLERLTGLRYLREADA